MKGTRERATTWTKLRLTLIMLVFVGLCSADWSASAKSKKKFSFPKIPVISKLIKLQYSKATKGDKPSCGSKFGATSTHGEAFLHVYNMTCWSCPKGMKRTINPDVKAKTACQTPGVEYARIIYRGKGKKKLLVGLQCPKGSFRHRLTDKCYSCPSGYKRTVFDIGGSKACEKRTKVKTDKAIYRGKPGCKKGYFQHGLTDQCFSCPKSYGRSLTMNHDLSKDSKACVKIGISLPSKVKKRILGEGKKKLAAIISQLKPLFSPILSIHKKVKNRKSLSLSKFIFSYSDRERHKVLVDLVKEEGLLSKFSWMKNKNLRGSSLKGNGESCSANKECESGICDTKGTKQCHENYIPKTFSLGLSGDGSYGFSYSFAFTSAFRMAWDKRGSAVPYYYYSHVMGVGYTAGWDAEMEFGFWNDTNKNLGGWSWGVTGGVSKEVGLSVSIWFTCPNQVNCFFGKEQNFRLLGVSIIPQVGVSKEAELSIAFNAGGTPYGK